ncbi:MAG: aminotransferase class I/II-fold pyridoxal phosphate-dependent enzyme, partial [Paracoccaceae bacterium]|nr:aminotransferase class I/II-fold pyridoxal phosphate-dependent enzyme [Paracoccaceae bacterium]
LDMSAMRALVDATQETGASFISDEIYHGIEYEAKAVTALSHSDDVYVVNSFSKYFSMTGWRAGWMVVPDDHVRRIERLAQNMFICAPHASQVAALAAMDCTDELDQNLSVYAANRQLMIEGLRDAGFTNFAPPDGAFYVYADIGDISTDSLNFCRTVLDEAGVAITPGLDFDPIRGHQTVRFSYARSTDDITEGLARLKRFMANRRR